MSPQLEAFVETVLLKLAEGKGITRIEQQEAALEVLSTIICSTVQHLWRATSKLHRTRSAAIFWPCRAAKACPV